jgi:hypothetical protein
VSGRKRNRNRNGGNPDGGNRGGNNEPKGGGNAPRGKRKRGGNSRGRGGQQRRGNEAGGRPRDPEDESAFWGDPADLPAARSDVRITDRPAAVPKSLGPPPLPGHEAVSEHYFGVVYDRAVMTGGALAAAGGLIDPEDLTDEDDR